MYPGNASVESDFSIIVWENDEYRTALTDVSLQGIMHTMELQNKEKKLEILVTTHASRVFRDSVSVQAVLAIDTVQFTIPVFSTMQYPIM